MVKAKTGAGAEVHVVLGKFALSLGGRTMAVGILEASEESYRLDVRPTEDPGDLEKHCPLLACCPVSQSFL